MLDWLIIGGGIHGVYVANMLMNTDRHAGRRRRSLRILDPNASLIARWRTLTARINMPYLRSPRVHHIDLAANSLYEYIKSRSQQIETSYLQPYYRPKLELFNQHCQHVIDVNGISLLHIQGKAKNLKICGGGYEISTDKGCIRAKNVVLCLGPSEKPMWPEWAKRLRSLDFPIEHIFDRTSTLLSICDQEDLAIIGGGLTAAQLWLNFANQSDNAFTAISRHDLRIHQFDSDPGWIGPKYLTEFQHTRDYTRRREIILTVRNHGSITEEIATKVNHLKSRGKLNLIVDDIKDTYLRNGGTVEIVFKKKNTAITKVKRILLATGFDSERPGGTFVDHVISEMSLPCAACGYPILNSALKWRPNLYVTGQLAELEIGPVARNIIGVRLAGRRLHTVFSGA